ncbi:hypothetical protein WA026_023404 [Henosepilachna vigintioctopunctata]|uniref:Uncharacterized protein n=1 Tax=Henosepilachna vigintioctopunctata TaxID=420089 RepID=A0AAW1UEZ0_9CUCU
MRSHPGRVVTVYQIVQILAPAYLEAATPANAIQSLKITVIPRQPSIKIIQPLNPDIFGEEDFLANSVTGRLLTKSRETQISQSTNGTKCGP